MRYGWSAFAASFLALEYILGYLTATAYNMDFLRRTDEDWERLWHSDCHRRCRSELQEHIDLACSVDIYRLYKRTDDYKYDFESEGGLALRNADIDKRTAASFLTYITNKHRKKRGIMQECCYDKGCTWEEYAETCHHYSRLPSMKENQCI